MGESFPLRAVAHELGISLGNCNTCIRENFPLRAVVFTHMWGKGFPCFLLKIKMKTYKNQFRLWNRKPEKNGNFKYNCFWYIPWGKVLISPDLLLCYILIKYGVQVHKSQLISDSYFNVQNNNKQSNLGKISVTRKVISDSACMFINY